MKKIYLKPSTKTFVVELPALMGNSVPLDDSNEATTNAGNEYENALSRGGYFWDDEEEDF